VQREFGVLLEPEIQVVGEERGARATVRTT
jgi:hypothetical protein